MIQLGDDASGLTIRASPLDRLAAKKKLCDSSIFSIGTLAPGREHVDMVEQISHGVLTALFQGLG
jgi:hypothetical protein